MKYCAVNICENRVCKNRKDLTFHRFPASETARKEWLLSCGLGENFDCSQGRVCSVHFSIDDFERDLKGELLGQPLKKRLKEGVVPHINIVQVKEELIYIDDFEIEQESPELDSSTACSPSTPNLDNSNFNNEADPSSRDNSNFNNEIKPSSSFSSDTVPVEPIESTSVVFLPRNDVTSSSLSYVPSSLPASQNWPGPYNFVVSFRPQEKNTKGVTWTYSPLKDKLYVGKDVPCPVNFAANTSGNVSIRVMALYGSPEHASEIVHRCVNHSMEELTKNVFEAEHLVRSESKMATYEKDQTTKRHSVVVPFEVPPVGQQYSTYIYKFACFGSCAGGPNRRPIMLIFTLEKDGEVVGRRRLDVKICACPGRDRRAEEHQLLPVEEKAPQTKRKESEMSPELVSLADTLGFTRNIILPPLKKKVRVALDGIYIIKAEDKDQYEFLVQMKSFYDMCKTMNNLPPDLKNALSYHRRKNNQDGDSS